MFVDAPRDFAQAAANDFVVIAAQCITERSRRLALQMRMGSVSAASSPCARRLHGAARHQSGRIETQFDIALQILHVPTGLGQPAFEAVPTKRQRKIGDGDLLETGSRPALMVVAALVDPRGVVRPVGVPPAL